MDKELKNAELEMDELDNVSGGLQAGNLLFTGKEVKTTSNTLFSGKKKKAGSLVYKEEGKDAGSKLLSGDVIEKSTYC
jgi:hypothetical protein